MAKIHRGGWVREIARPSLTSFRSSPGIVRLRHGRARARSSSSRSDSTGDKNGNSARPSCLARPRATFYFPPSLQRQNISNALYLPA
ncbi:hypothetical protein PUN28_012490 [Cardiocondyla obscurior]|uniref:Uncharacterized protein n=1 Tax=Cardiocondyla obscurior TaxID=286306 RepID=A0AAW2FG46_9HYME